MFKGVGSDRKTYAVFAMQGLLASWEKEDVIRTSHLTDEEIAERIAISSFMIADAMVKASKK